MKIYKPIGSKERFLEMFQGVTKVNLNEVVADTMQTGTELVAKAFEELKNKVASIKQTNTQTVDNENFVEIITNDQDGSEITFSFKIASTEADQDGVFNVDNAVLSKFKIKSPTLNVEMPENMQAVQDFNAAHGDEIMSVVGEYADFETDTMSVEDDEIYAEAVKLIDKVPYKKGSEEIQTHKHYADQKPTNPEVRVGNDELQKFVKEEEEFIPHGGYTVSNSGGYEVMLNDAGDAARVRDAFGSDNPKTSDWLEIEYMPDEETGECEPIIDPNGYNIPLNQVMRLQENDEDLQTFIKEMEDFVASTEEEDILAMPPDFSPADMPKLPTDDDGTTGDPYDQVDADYESGEASPEEQAQFTQAYDNLVAAGNETPTAIDIENEVNKLQGNVKPVEKTRAIPRGAEQFWEGKDDVKDVNVNDVLKQGYGGLMSDEKKKQLIFKAQEIIDSYLGTMKDKIPKEIYIKNVKGKALELFRDMSVEMNESTDQDRYEDVVFMQGEEADEALEILRNQGEDAALQHLMQWHDSGNHMGSQELGHGSSDQTYEKDGYTMAWSFPLNYIGLQYELSGLDEEAEKGDYPDQMGKKFKPKNQMPKKKKKPQSVVKLGEESEVPREYWGNAEDEMSETEELPSEKPEDGDFIEGGVADDSDVSEFNSQQIMIGIGVEMEHTDDPKIALEIAMDHLTEIPDYYTRLDKMEKEAGVEDNETDEGMVDNTPEQEEMTDELLGYKPHNVNDYASEEFDYTAAERDYHDKEDMRQHPEDYQGDEEHPLAGIMDTGDEPIEKLPDAEVKGVNRALGGGKEEIIDEEEDFDEYSGEIGDRFQDGEGNQFTVRDKVNGGVTLQGQGGEKEIATRDIQFLKKLSEEKVVKKEIITEEQIKTARETLKNRGVSEGMTKKEAVQLLIKHNIK